MKILHIGDLHLGKRIGGYSLLEDQKYFLNNTITYMNTNGITHLIIAGDIYDIASPSGEAINIFSEFLNEVKKNHIKAFIISGNHDSNERVGYGSRLIADTGIHINTNIKDAVIPIVEDGINYYLIPYATAQEINAAFDQSFREYGEAMAYVISQMNLDKSKINIAVSHQLVLPTSGKPILGGSEDPIIGTIQNIDGAVYSDFSYVALGHIHKPQKVSDTIRYAGSPLAYHSDETKYEKSYTIITVENDDISISTDKIVPLRDSVEIKDTFHNILVNYPEYKNYYVYITITDGEVENAIGQLKNVYPYTVSMRYERKEAQGVNITQKIEDIEKISTEDLFTKLYEEQIGLSLSDYQKSIILDLLKECGD